MTEQISIILVIILVLLVFNTSIVLILLYNSFIREDKIPGWSREWVPDSEKWPE